MEFLLPYFILVPLLGVALISVFCKYWKESAAVFSVLTNIVLCAGAVYCVVILQGTGTLMCKTGGWPASIGIPLVLDGLSAFMLVVVNLITCFISLFAYRYMEKYTDKTKFYMLFLLMILGMNGLILAGDIFSLFVCLEIASLASYALVAFGAESDELEASFKYLVMSAVGTFFILIGIALLYSITSTLNLTDMGGILALKGKNGALSLVTIFFIMGFGIKAAIFPFHAWLPDAHQSAPAPVSATLSGVLIKTLGVYPIIRILYNVIGMNATISEALMFLAACSMLLGMLLAIMQWDIKRLLAYSSISHIGFIMLGFGIGTPLAILGSLFHIFNHSVFKSLLFLNSGAIEYATGTRDMRNLGGLRKKMPVTAATSMIGSISISGVPPFNGFFSKLLIIFAAVQANHLTYASIAVITSIITLAVFLRIQKNTFFGALKDSYKNILEVPFSMKLPMLLLTFICIFGGLLLLPCVSKYFLMPARDALLNVKGASVMLTSCVK